MWWCVSIVICVASALSVLQYSGSAENQLGGSTRNHMGRRVRRSGNDPWHHRCVGHAQAQKSVHAQLWVDNSEFIHTHLAGAYRMSKARRGKPGKFLDL